MARLTKDEQFLIKLYELASDEGDLDLQIKFLDFGEKLVYKEKITKNIVRDLSQANFIKKLDSDTIQLTQNGIVFAQKCQEGWVS